jgi:hypothetical protein
VGLKQRDLLFYGRTVHDLAQHLVQLSATDEGAF